MMRRLKLSLHRESALTASRVMIGTEKLVYVLVADKRIKYAKGKSKIAYIGTTRNGGARIAGSVATRAPDILTTSGVHSFQARVITCRPRQRVRTWLKLERALLIEFKRRFGQVPKCNTHGSRMRQTDELDYFHPAGIQEIVEDLS